MNFFSFPVRRPVTIVMTMLIALVVGGISLWRMKQELIPKITFPNVLVIYTYEGSGPEEIEKTIARTVESAIKTVSDVKKVTSTATEGILMINVEFNWGTDLAAASIDVREKIDLVKDYLPLDASDPIIMRIDMTQMPVMFVSVDSDDRDLAELGDIADDIVSPMIERLPGVATVTLMGKRSREIHIDVDREKLNAYGIGLDSIINMIRYENLNMSAGNMEIGNSRYRIRAKGEFQNLEQIENMIVGYGISSVQMQTNNFMALTGMTKPLTAKGAINPIRLKDVAKVKEGLSDKNGRVTRMTQQGEHEGIGFAIMKESDANLVEVARTVEKALPQIQKDLPKGVTLNINFNFSEFVTDAIQALRTAAIEGGIFAVIILFIFLWEVVPTLIISVSIPLSLLFAFVCMYFSGYSLNIMTMGALVIALGKMVDDSIVVLENIYRHIQLGDDPKYAAEIGTKEVAIADIAATVVAVVIFLPIAFITGLSAQLFQAFAATIAFALFGSLFAAFTAIPMLSSQLLRKHVPKPGKKVRHPFQVIQNGYAKLLGWALDNRGKVMVLALLVLVMTGLMAVQTPTEFMPDLVGGMYMGKVKLPLGTPYEQTNRVSKNIMDKLVKKINDFDLIFMMIGETAKPEEEAAQGGQTQGTNQTQFFMKMKKFAKGRTTTDKDLEDTFDQIAKENPAAEVSLQSMGSVQQSTTKPLTIKLFGDDLDVLKTISTEIAAKVKKVEGVRNVTSSLQEGTPEQLFIFDRTKMFNYGVVAAQAEMALRTSVYGQLASRYRQAGKEYDMIVRLDKDQRKDLKDLGNIPISSPMGFTFPLKEIGEFKYNEGPASIVRENSKRLATIEGDKGGDRKLGLISADLAKIMNETRLPEGYMWEFGGEIEQQSDAFSDLGIMFILSLLLVYMVLAALYESMIHPFTILAAVPFAFTGAFIGLYITDVAIGVTAFIGLIMLVGIVANNSILLIDFVLHYHRQGMDRRTAVIEAGKIRLRPILMTAIATLIAVVPIALGAEGMEIQQPMGIVVIGGLVSSTLLTLLIIPVLYTIIEDVSEDVKNIVRKILRRKETTAEPKLFENKK